MKVYGKTLRDILLYLLLNININSYARIYRKGRLITIVYIDDETLNNIDELNNKLLNSPVSKIELLKDDCFIVKTYKIDLT